MEDLDLEKLLHAYRQGDLESLGLIVDRTRKPLFRFIYGMVGDVHAAEDVFQDVWLRAVRGLHTYKSDRLLSWLYRIARNRVIDLSRKRKPDASLQQPVGGHGRGDADGVGLEAFVASNKAGPDRGLGDRELGERIRAAVATLPRKQKEVFLMRTEAELPFKEIADIQGVSINTALARMQYALRRLREQLAEDHHNLPKPGRTP